MMKTMRSGQIAVAKDTLTELGNQSSVLMECILSDMIREIEDDGASEELEQSILESLAGLFHHRLKLRSAIMKAILLLPTRYHLLGEVALSALDAATIWLKPSTKQSMDQLATILETENPRWWDDSLIDQSWRIFTDYIDSIISILEERLNEEG